MSHEDKVQQNFDIILFKKNQEIDQLKQKVEVLTAKLEAAERENKLALEAIRSCEDNQGYLRDQVERYRALANVKHIEPAYQISRRHNDLADEQAATNADALAAEEQNHEANFQTYK